MCNEKRLFYIFVPLKGVAPEIHWNTGNLGRTSLAVGADLHLVQPLGFSLEGAGGPAGGAGLLAARAADGVAGLERSPRRCRGWASHSCSPPPPANDYWEVRYPPRTVLVFGRESVGLPPELLAAHPERQVRIPTADPNCVP